MVRQLYRAPADGQSQRECAREGTRECARECIHALPHSSPTLLPPACSLQGTTDGYLASRQTAKTRPPAAPPLPPPPTPPRPVSAPSCHLKIYSRGRTAPRCCRPPAPTPLHRWYDTPHFCPRGTTGLHLCRWPCHSFGGNSTWLAVA